MAAGNNKVLCTHVVIHQASIFELVATYLRVRECDRAVMAEDPEGFLMDMRGLYSEESLPCPRICMSKIVKLHLGGLGEARSYFISQSLRLMGDPAHCSTGLLLLSILLQAKSKSPEQRVILGLQAAIDRLVQGSLSHVDCAYLLAALCFNCDYLHDLPPFKNLAVLVVSIFDSAQDCNPNSRILRRLVQIYLETVSSQKSYKTLDMMMEFLPHMPHMYCTDEGVKTVLSMLNDFQRNKMHDQYPFCIVRIKRSLLKAVRSMFLEKWVQTSQCNLISAASDMVEEVLHYPLGFR